MSVVESEGLDSEVEGLGGSSVSVSEKSDM